MFLLCFFDQFKTTSSCLGIDKLERFMALDICQKHFQIVCSATDDYPQCQIHLIWVSSPSIPAVSRMIVRQGAILAVIGIGVGLAGAFALTRLMDAMLFGVSTTDPELLSSAKRLTFRKQ